MKSAYRATLTPVFLLCLGVFPIYAQYAHTRGVEILDADNHPIQLKGTNLGNWFVPEGYMWRFDGGPQSPKEIEAFLIELVGPIRAEEFWKTYRERYVTQQDIRFIRAQGFNTIRVPLHWKLLQTDDAEGFQLLDRVVQWCHVAGLYVVLDLHAAPADRLAPTSTTVTAIPGSSAMQALSSRRSICGQGWRDTIATSPRSWVTTCSTSLFPTTRAMRPCIRRSSLSTSESQPPSARSTAITSSSSAELNGMVISPSSGRLSTAIQSINCTNIGLT
jgi:hypothetical protein